VIGLDRAWLAILACAALAVAAAAAPDPSTRPASAPAVPAPVLPGHALAFPRDLGSHPQFRLEWWYITGWLETSSHERLGFQVTFFRTRPSMQENNPSAFAPRQLLIAHCALSDPGHGRLWHDQRIRRAGLGLAEAAEDDTRVWIDDWRLERRGSIYQAQLQAVDFSIELQLSPTQPPMLNGEQGFSRKGPSPPAASYYYSLPHLRVSGHVARNSRAAAVTGEAWLDHEWSSEYLDPAAAGWDWVGINLDDGAALMAFRIRDRAGLSYWAGATLRGADGTVHTYAGGDVEFTPRRRWRSSRSAVEYPVSIELRVGARRLRLEPLLDDQENDARLSSGALYWEGAVTAYEDNRATGRGYLELTGYDRPLSLGR
jgi:predicted secreted hydrolase